MFPQGGPGLALLLLRLSVLAVLIISAERRSGVTSVVFGLAVLVSIAIAIGFMTPFMSVIACAFAVINLVSYLHADIYFYVFAILDALALLLLGPGAYSVDARLFGRQVTVLPPRTGRDQA